MHKTQALLLTLILLGVPLAGCTENGDAPSDSLPDIDPITSDISNTTELLELRLEVSELRLEIMNLTQSLTEAQDTIEVLREQAALDSSLLESLQDELAEVMILAEEHAEGWADTNLSVAELTASLTESQETVNELSATLSTVEAMVDLLTNGWDDFNQSLSSARPEFVGSWTNPIHSSYPSRSMQYNCVSDDGWKAADAEATLEALEATHQNLFMIGARTTSGVDFECEWLNIDRLLNEFENSSNPITTMVVLSDDLNLSGYKALINETKIRATAHSDLLGVSVDDFSQALVSPRDVVGSGLTRSDVGELHALANSETPSLGASPTSFMPYLPGESVGTYYADDGLLFGLRGCNNTCALLNGDTSTDGDFYFYPEDTHRMNVSFQTPVGLEGQEAMLSFMLFETIRETPYTMDIVFTLNGDEVGRYTMADATPNEPQMRIVELSLPQLASGNMNDFGMHVDTNGTTITKYVNKIANMWDFQIESEEGETYSVELSSVVTTSERGQVPTREIYSLDSMVGQTNQDWNIFEFMDGVLFKFPGREREYNITVHDRFVKSTCEQAHEANIPCMEVFWANDQWTNDVVGSIDRPSFDGYLDSAAAHTDGVIFWMFDLNLYDRSLGKFSERHPWNNSQRSYQTAVGFGAQTSPSPGWTHAWTFKINQNGNYTIGWSSQGNLAPERIYHSVYVNGTQVVHLDARTGTPLPNGEFWYEQTFVFNRTMQVDIVVKLVDGYSGNAYASQFSITNLESVDIDMFDAQHTAGVSASTEYMNQYLTHQMFLWSLVG